MPPDILAFFMNTQVHNLKITFSKDWLKKKKKKGNAFTLAMFNAVSVFFCLCLHYFFIAFIAFIDVYVSFYRIFGLRLNKADKKFKWMKMD